jgi:hypothetical protein
MERKGGTYLCPHSFLLLRRQHPAWGEVRPPNFWLMELNNLHLRRFSSLSEQNKSRQRQLLCSPQIRQQGGYQSCFTSEKGAKFVLIGGFPLNEPIKQHGPFVMNNQEEIYQTFEDYQTGKNGFENAGVWHSKIKDMMDGKPYEEL